MCLRRCNRLSPAGRWTGAEDAEMTPTSIPVSSLTAHIQVKSSQACRPCGLPLLTGGGMLGASDYGRAEFRPRRIRQGPTRTTLQIALSDPTRSWILPEMGLTARPVNHIFPVCDASRNMTAPLLVQEESRLGSELGGTPILRAMLRTAETRCYPDRRAAQQHPPASRRGSVKDNR